MRHTNFIKSFLVAIRGLFYGISGQRNIKIQIAVGLVILIISALLRIPKMDFIIILLVSFLVIILELVNTCFEKLIDSITLEYHKEFGKIKDIMAGAVLLSAILSVIVGFLILYNPLINTFKNILPASFNLIIIDFILFLGIIILIIYLLFNLIRKH